MNEPRQQVDFSKIAAELQAVPPNPSRVVTIPVWGWTGDGKTCGVLTAYHYADPLLHGIGYALVDDLTLLEKAIAGVEEYEGLNLPDLARATTARLPPLLAQFIDKSRWPTGTEKATQYLLRIRGAMKTFGFVYLPDLKGGSFRAADGQAQAVLAGADGCAIMVDPTKYDAAGSGDAKRYRDAVDACIQRCAEADVPAAVMLTKADDAEPANDTAVDKAHVRLTSLTSGVKCVEVFRVSILGPGVKLTEESPPQPPPAEQRDPTTFLHAWAWLFSQVLTQDTSKQPRRAPPTRLEASAQVPRLSAKTVPEIRQVGAFGAPPGDVLCALPSTRHPRFLLQAGDDLLAATITGDDPPRVEALGLAVGLSDIEDPRAESSGGELFVGSKSDAGSIWNGAIGDDVVKVALPSQLRTWTAIGAGRLVGVDESGRLHLFLRQGEQWKQSAFLADFVPRAEAYFVAWVPEHSAAVVSNGEATGAVRVESDQFGDRIELGVEIGFGESALVWGSRAGVYATYAGKELTVWSAGKSDNRAVELLDTEHAVALASDLPWVAFVDVGLGLDVFRITAGGVLEASALVELEDQPTGMAWALGAPILLITTPETWAVYQARGFDAGE